MPAVSRKQQRFFGMVRATQKGEMENPSPEVSKAAASASMSSVKKFAKTKHKGLPEKKMKKEDYKYPLYAPYTKVDEFHANKRPLDEEGYDHYRDRQLERGTWRSAGSNKPRSGGTQPKPMPKKKEGGPSALDYVKKSIEAKYGKGAIMDTSKKKTQKEETLLEKGMSEKDMDSVLKGHKYSKKQLMSMSKKSTQAGRHGEAQSMYKAARAMKEESVLEAKVDAGKSPEKKEADRNLRKFGVKGNEMAHGKLRRSLHRMNRGDKKVKGDKSQYVETEGYAPGDVDQKVGAVTAIPKKEQEAARKRLLPKSAAKRATMKKEETIIERGDFWHPDPDKDRKLGGPGANQRAREDRAAASKPKSDPKKLRPGESYMDWNKRQKANKMKKEGTISFKDFLSEGNRTGRMMHKSKTQVTGHISADRGDDEKKNRKGRKGLEKDLKKHGIGHKKGVGEYKYGSGETGREVSYQTTKPDKMSKRRFGKVMRRLGRKHGQESVITKDKDKSAKLHYTEKGSKAKSDSIGKTKAGKHPEGYGETSGTKVRGGKLPKKTNKGAYHYG